MSQKVRTFHFSKVVSCLKGLNLVADIEQFGVVFAGGADLHCANKLVALVGTGRKLVAEIGLAVFLGPVRIRGIL